MLIAPVIMIGAFKRGRIGVNHRQQGRQRFGAQLEVNLKAEAQAVAAGGENLVACGYLFSCCIEFI